MAKDKSERKNQYIYIVQGSAESAKCKIGKTNDLERRLKEYNNMTGKSKDNVFGYLFTCKVKNMTRIEKDMQDYYGHLREEKSKEIYFYNSTWFEKYVSFIKSHPSFVEEIFIKRADRTQIVKIIKKTTPTLEERGVSRKELLQKAQKIENDEFFTREEDVEKELDMYSKSIWKNKVVFCNCDDAVGYTRKETSAFALYFLERFSDLSLKKLICTHYAGKVDLFNQGPKGYVFTKDGFREIKEFSKSYTGSFDDPLSLKILHEEADIVCTNPPFSRAIDYWKMIIESGKRFIIISNITNPITLAFVPYFRDGKVWAGYNRVDWYLTPKRELTDAAGHWYTNIPIKDRPKYKQLKILPLKEIPEKYKKYDDSKTLIVNNCYIPSDYMKPFAVSARPILNGLLEKGYQIVENQYFPCVNGKQGFRRVLVKKTQE